MEGMEGKTGGCEGEKEFVRSFMFIAPVVEV